MSASIPTTQHAVQLVGEDELRLHPRKAVVRPGPRQILCRVEAEGLCFSDLKLLKQFTKHVRKSEIVSGIGRDVLDAFPGYVPGAAATVPGHEAVVRVVETGPDVTRCGAGQRFLVQTDYRWLRTDQSNGAFGYNIEGGLQEYVLLDERIITSPDGEFMLLAAAEDLSASAVALVEPWACVENAYASPERQGLKAGGRLLVVADAAVPRGSLRRLFDAHGRPGAVTWVSSRGPAKCLDLPVETAAAVDGLADEGFDDIVCFGARAETVEALFAKLAPKGLLNLCLCGERFGRPVVTAVGRLHYGGIRIVGTTGDDPCRSMETIPANGEIRRGDTIHVVGAGGPMGVMHVIRDLCHGVAGVTAVAADIDDGRLAALDRLAKPLAARNGLGYRSYNSGRDAAEGRFDYAVIMAPVPTLVAQAVAAAAEGGIVNVFAGIPAAVSGEIDLDAYVAGRLYFIGTSGSVLQDMKTVLAKVEAGSLDTNVSVGAVCGLDGAVDGIRAVEKRAIAGKIVVYPACRELPLTPLDALADRLPAVAAKLADGVWTRDAEQELLRACAR